MVLLLQRLLSIDRACEQEDEITIKLFEKSSM